MKNYYGMFKRLMLLIALVAFANFSYAQRDLTGRVTDSGDGNPIPGVSVVVKGSTNGTITDFEGNFSLKVNNFDIVVFSYMGYISQEIAAGTNNTLRVLLEPSAETKDEVVVIGYGTVKKNDATGSVTSISSQDFNKGAITTPEELLMGKASGVVITTNGGAPGSGSQIRIRGGSSLRASNDPLIVIDGIPIDNSGIGGMSNPLSSINPNDIETFTVLKDASASAIYGSRASNGVIIITTKRGKKGKLTATYNGNVSIGIADKLLEVYNGSEFKSLIQSRIANNGLAANANNILGSANTDWQNEIYQNAISSDNNVSLSGSAKDIPYRASFGYTNQEGLLKQTSMERTSVDLAISPTLLEGNLKVDLNVKGSFTHNSFGQTGSIGGAIQMDPTQPIMNGNTRYGGFTSWTQSPTDINALPNNIATVNPVAGIEYTYNNSIGKRYFGNIQLDYKMPFLPELSAVFKGAYDYYNVGGDNNRSGYSASSYREPATNLQSYENIRKNSLIDFYLKFNKDLGSSQNLDLTAGYSWQHYYREGQNSNSDYTANSSGEWPGRDTVDYKNENFLVSFFGRANYTILNKYILSATVRYDGSSRFAEENRWGLFPSFALAWKINEESFMKNVSAISNLKLRLGYGVTGQQDIPGGNYPYIPVYQISQTGTYYQFGNKFYPTQRPNAYDANIKWEETTTQNIALDFGFIKDRITGSVDVYKRTTDDLINEIPVAAGTNFSNYLITNVGSLENKGLEAELTGKIISKADMSWELSVNFTYNQNEITKLTAIDDPSYPGYDVGGIAGGVGNNVQINSVGYPANTFFLFNQVYGTNGMPIEGLYVDKTGKGGNVSGNNANKYYLQSPAPDYLIGVSSRFTFKNFDFSFAGRFNIGNYVYNNNASNMGLYQNLYNQSGYTANIIKDVEKTKFTTAQYWSDFYLENASFFRMDNISLGYAFDKFFTEKINGRVAFTVQNAFVVTKYSGLDPEVASGIDNNIFPRPRTFMLGLNLNF